MLTAEGEGALSVSFIDDYSYDAVEEALENGSTYEMIAYNDTQYCYYEIAFTSLPVLTLDSAEEIGKTYTAGTLSIADPAGGSLTSGVQVHLHSGDDESAQTRSSYRLELHKTGKNGKDKKQKLPLLGMDKDSDWLLIANAFDGTRVRSYMGWQIWRDVTGGDAYNVLQSRMTELFVQGRYCGLYQLLERVKPETQLKRCGGNADTDIAVRTAHSENLGDRPYRFVHAEDEATGERHKPVLQLRYSPEGMDDEEAFDLAEDFLRLMAEEGDPRRLDDEEFIRLAEKRLDVRGLMQYYAFMQLLCLHDGNVSNNLYVYAVQENGETRYHLAPWDLDGCFDNSNEDYSVSCSLTCAVRLLELDALNSREILQEIWEPLADRYKSGGLEELTAETERLVNGSGAFRRDSSLSGGDDTLDLTEFLQFTVSRIDSVTRYLRENYPAGGK